MPGCAPRPGLGGLTGPRSHQRELVDARWQGDETLRSRTFGGSDMTDTYLGRFSEYCADGQFFESVIQCIYECYVRPGEVVIDAGANRGRHTLPLCATVERQGRVYAVEPIQALARDLRRAQAQFPQLAVIEAALTSYSGTTRFHHVKNSDYFSGISQCSYPFTPEIEVLTVPAKRLDEVISEREAVAFVKMDLEGGEFDALQGARRILERDRPLVVFEHAGLYRSVYYNYSVFDLEKFWHGLGYRLVDLFGRPVDGMRLEHWPVWYLVASASERSNTLAENLHVPVILAAQAFEKSNRRLDLSSAGAIAPPTWVAAQ
jgi:FkbM family methyltransferase